jgi:exodeoxyribonuclease VII large subunit
MSSTDPYASTAADPGNAPAFSVSELAFALKRTLEDAFGHVRLRGEISKVTRHASGHVYLTLKDDKAVIDGVIWKGSVRGLKAQPEQGLEVIVTGRITTYPARSGYQIIIESLEPAGVGALLAQLERLKARLAGEGLFDAARKPALPLTPAVIGVITSPTGAVIRDILHRITDRWPVRVIVWPVVVQGDSAAGQVAAAIEGFNALVPGGPIPRPDVLIVARGGGSIEDLWPFNDERLTRVAAASLIPLISAVGHETDTTLIDFAAARRAPTPTAAAELATPVLAELRAGVAVASGRLERSVANLMETRRARLTAAAAALPRLTDLVELSGQRFDNAAARLAAGLSRNVAAHTQRLTGVSARLAPPLLSRPVDLAETRVGELGERLAAAIQRRRRLAEQRADLPGLGARMQGAIQRRLAQDAAGLERLEQLRRSFDPDRPLALGFARVHRRDGALVREAGGLAAGEGVRLVFADGTRDATIDGGPPPPAARRRREGETGAADDKPQGSLFD